MEKELRFSEAVLQVIRKSFVFDGRARRKEFWSWSLFSALLNILATVAVMMTTSSSTAQTSVSLILSLLMFFPSLSVTVRRLHDVNRSGWWIGGYYIGIVVYTIFAIIGSGAMKFVLILSILFLLAALCWGILLLVWNFTEGTHGPNIYGKDPKRD